MQLGNLSPDSSYLVAKMLVEQNRGRYSEADLKPRWRMTSRESLSTARMPKRYSTDNFEVVATRQHKKGHGKPIRRLAMTSILKQNTVCFALPLC